MNISQIFSSKLNGINHLDIQNSAHYHAKILESTNFDLNLIKEHEKMILIGGRLFRLENPKNYNLNGDVITKVVSSTDGKLQLHISNKTTPSIQSNKLSPPSFPPQFFWEKAISPFGLDVLSTKTHLKEIGVDIWSNLLKGILPNTPKPTDSQYTKLLESWVAKSQSYNSNDFQCLSFQLPFFLEDSYQLADFSYYKHRMNDKIHKLVIRVGSEEEGIVCSIFMSSDDLFLDFFSKHLISDDIKATINKSVTDVFPTATINFYKQKFISLPTTKPSGVLNEYG